MVELVSVGCDGVEIVGHDLTTISELITASKVEPLYRGVFKLRRDSPAWHEWASRRSRRLELRAADQDRRSIEASPTPEVDEPHYSVFAWTADRDEAIAGVRGYPDDVEILREAIYVPGGPFDGDGRGDPSVAEIPGMD